MKDYILQRDSYVLNSNIVLAPDMMLGRHKTVAILKKVRETGIKANESMVFLENSFKEVELSINKLMDGLENRIDYLTTSVVHISKVKASKSASSTKFDAKAIDLTSGRYESMTYSASDNGLILSTKNRTLLSVEKT